MSTTQPHIYYVAYPTSLTLASANAVQTYSTLRELKALMPQTQIFIPRMTREPNPFDELGVHYLPRIGIGRLSRLYKSTLWYYMERSVFAWLVAFIMLWRSWRGTQIDVIYVREVICAYWLSRHRTTLVWSQSRLRSPPCGEYQSLAPQRNVGTTTRSTS